MSAPTLRVSGGAVSALIGVEPLLCRPASDAVSRPAVFVAGQGVFAPSNLDAHDARDDVIHVIALYDGRPAGTVRLYPTGPGRWLGDRLALAAHAAEVRRGG